MRVGWIQIALATASLCVALGCEARNGRPDADDAADGIEGDDNEGDEEGDEVPFDCTIAGSAGPRTLRLLTRREYANTIRDIVGVEALDISPIPSEATIAGYNNNAQASVVTARHVD